MIFAVLSLQHSTVCKYNAFYLGEKALIDTNTVLMQFFIILDPINRLYCQKSLKKKARLLRTLFIGIVTKARLCCLLKQHISNMTNSLSWIKAFRTYADTVHDAMTAENAERIIKVS